MNAVISTEVDDIDGLKARLAEVPDMKGLELASRVSTKEPYFVGDESASYRISALDIGIKKNILRNLARRDCYIKVFPYNTSFEEMAAFSPDGYFFSNGPGDPEPLTEAIEAAKKVIESGTPAFGICLGHQVLAQAMGISTYEPGGNTGDDLYTHAGEEAGMVLKGEIELTLDCQIFRLQTGDSFSFSADIPHRYRNPGTVEAQIVWANTPVTMKR